MLHFEKILRDKANQFLVMRQENKEKSLLIEHLQRKQMDLENSDENFRDNSLKMMSSEI